MTTPAPIAPAQTRPSTFRELIDLWDQQIECAKDCGHPPARVQKWYERNWIPVRHWPGVIAGAREHRQCELSADDLLQMASPSAEERETAA